MQRLLRVGVAGRHISRRFMRYSILAIQSGGTMVGC